MKYHKKNKIKYTHTTLLKIKILVWNTTKYKTKTINKKKCITKKKVNLTSLQCNYFYHFVGFCIMWLKNGALCF